MLVFGVSPSGGFEDSGRRLFIDEEERDDEGHEQYRAEERTREY